MVGEFKSASVVICSHSEKRFELLGVTIRSVSQQTIKPAEVIVVVDHNLGLAAAVSKNFQDVKVVENANAPGLSGARNQGIAIALGEIVAFLDDDAEAAPDWLENLIRPYANEAVAGTGGFSRPQWQGTTPTWFPPEFYWVVGCSYKGLPDRTSDVRNVIGCSMSFRRSIFAEIGLFRVGLGREATGTAGGEETEICIRILQSNPTYKIVYVPESIVAHHVSEARARFSYFRDRCISEGRSKAKVVAQVGANDGLESERSYVLKTLPMGVARGFYVALRTFEVSGLARAASIVAGLVFTLYGYLMESFSTQRQTKSLQGYRPRKVIDVDIANPLLSVDLTRPSETTSYGGLFCLVRHKGVALRVVEFASEAMVVTPEQLAEKLGSDVGFDQPQAQENKVLRENPKVSVIIATHNRPSGLRQCIDSLLKQDYPNFEIVVSDNAPADDASRDLVHKIYGSNNLVKYVRDDLPGLGRAHNAGLSVAQGEIIAITDDDVTVDPRWLASLCVEFAADAKVGCVTGMILPAELETRAQFWTEKHGGFGKGFERQVFDLAKNRRSGRLYPYTAGQFGSGANMAFRTDALSKIGGFDAALGAGTKTRGGDDLASFVDVIQAGYRLVYQPQALVWHLHRREEVGIEKQAFNYGMGLGAFLGRALKKYPQAGRQLFLALPEGLRHMMGSSAPKMKRLPDDYPRGLVWRERIGILAGIVAYFRYSKYGDDGASLQVRE